LERLAIIKGLKDKEFLRAKNCAYRLLGYRLRSTKEINERLKKRGFSLGIIKKTVKYLEGLDYLSDENFAKFWVQSKIKSSPVGWSLMQYQLRQKGIADKTIETVLKNYAPLYNEADAAKKLINSRINYYKGSKGLKLKRKLYDYLRRRGFSQEVIQEVIGQKVK